MAIEGATSWYHVVTCGAPTAHSLGYKHGGLHALISERQLHMQVILRRCHVIVSLILSHGLRALLGQQYANYEGAELLATCDIVLRKIANCASFIERDVVSLSV